MTQIITRYFADAAAAQRAMTELVEFHRFAPKIIHIWTDASALVGGLAKRKVAPETVQAYAQRLTSGEVGDKVELIGGQLTMVGTRRPASCRSVLPPL